MRNRSIFHKVRLLPNQLKTVADRRLADAQVLRDTKKNIHANGCMYLGGFVLECLLKAKMLEKFTWLQSAGSPASRSKKDSYIWSLCYRFHHLDELLAVMPDIVARLDLRRATNLKSLCGQWTIYARYSPQTATITEAIDFLEKIEELKEWLR